MYQQQINALPEPVRSYIHQLETIADPAGLVQEIVALRDLVKDLTAEIVRLKGQAVNHAKDCDTQIVQAGE